MLLLTLFTGFAAAMNPEDAIAQNWRRKTPRDTVKVNANTPGWTQSKMSLSSGFEINCRFLGTFGVFAGQGGKGFDTKYTYEQPPGWAAPLPLINPPSFNNQSHNVYLEVVAKSPDLQPGEVVKTFETTYQSNHIYTGRYTSVGIPLNFRIHAGDGKPNTYYTNGSGSVTVEMAQWTAGISMRSKSLTFGNVAIGSTSTLVDSIASYGVDPLQIDSVKILTTNNQPSKDFTFVSQRGTSFTLPNEAVNEFKITFSPSQASSVIGLLYVYCKNTDQANRVKVVQLTGYGVAPKLGIGPKNIDFGKVRVGKSGIGYVNISNGGNGDLQITSTIYAGDNVFSGSPNAPIKVSPNSTGQIMISFAPLAQKKYRGVLTIKGQNVPQDSVIFTGEGAMPGLTYSDTLIEFGSVRRNDNSVRYLTIKNAGDFTANVLSMLLTGPNKAAYRLDPDPGKFLLDPGDSLKIKITFEPTTGPQGSRTAYIDIAQDDGQKAKRIVLLGEELEPTMLLSRNIVDFGNVKIGVTKWDTVIMYNSSNADLSVFNIFRKGSMPDYNMFGLDPNWPKVLKGLRRDTIRVNFTPQDRQQYGSWVHTDVNGQRDSIFLTGRGVLPKAAFTPPELDFGVVPTNWSTTMVTELKDTGDYKMDVCSVEIIGKDKDFFAVKQTNPALPTTLIEYGKGMNIPVEFKTLAQTGASYEAWLKVYYCDGSTDSIRLRAKEQAQYLQFGQKTVDFGKVRVRNTSMKPAILSNGSNTTLSVGQLYITAAPPYFTTATSSATVDKRSQGNVDIVFAPLTKGDFTGYLHATGGDIQTDSVLLKGIGAAPIPRFSDTVINFGTIIIPGTGLKSLIVENIGNWLLKARVSIENDAYNEFSVTLPSASNIDSIDEAKQQEYPLTFVPKTPQLIHTADLKFVLDDSSTYIVKLIARDESLYINIDSPNVHFGKVRVGQPKTTQVHLVNTSAVDRHAEDVSLTPADGIYTVTPNGKINVSSRSYIPLDVTFNPTAMGDFNSLIIATGGDIDGIDTVYLTGTGAMPMPKLSTPTLDFGVKVVGDAVTLPATLTNEGNWLLHVTSVQLKGNNTGDFTFDIANDTSIAEGGARTFNVKFVASTPLQTTPRTATLEFTQDDGKTFELQLTAMDKMPIATDIGFGEYYARPGDKIYAVLKLKTEIPSNITSREFEGNIQYDASLVDLLTIEKYGLTSTPDWTLDTGNTRTPGSFPFKISSQNDELREAGSLMRFIFQAKKDLDKTAQSPLILTDLKYNDTRELVAAINDGLIIIDSSCGATQVVVGGEVKSSYITQNVPNPFGSTTGGETVVTMTIARNDAEVLLRVLDASGREVMRPVDHKRYNQGMYDVRIKSSELGGGTFIYEFTVDGQRPITKKMVVQE